MVPTIHVKPAPDANSLAEFLLASFNNPELADVEFVICPEDQQAHTVYAHRLILAGTCNHFRATFTSGCAETVGIGGRCRIELPNWVTYGPFLWLLSYLYHGYDPQAAQVTALRLSASANGDNFGSTCSIYSVQKNINGKRRPRFLDADIGDDLCCLLRLSDMYDLEHLKQWVEYRLQALLMPENLLALSTHAYFCNAKQLLRLCVYHMQHLYADFAGTDEWEELEQSIKEQVLTGCCEQPLGPSLAQQQQLQSGPKL